MLQVNHIYHGNALDILKGFDSESVDMVVTSPPYYGLRSYNTEGQIWDGNKDCEHDWTDELKIWHQSRECKSYGQQKEVFDDSFQWKGTKHAFCLKCNAWKGELGTEPTPQLYIKHLIQIFDECKRVLKKTGSLWVNIGDTYASQGGLSKPEHLAKANVGATKAGVQRGTRYSTHITNMPVPEKSLIGIPERFVIAMTDSGWIRRNTVIWYKPNCMPSSAKDRFTVDFEYFYFFTKSKKYYFETQYEPFSPLNINRKGEKQYLSKKEKTTMELGIRNGYLKMGNKEPNTLGRMKRCVWKVTTQPYPEAHFATFPEKLVETPIKACCPPNGIILDPFMGSGTTAVVAKKQFKNYIGIELNENYIKLAEKRLNQILI